jgi:MFS transporter, OFA family, oxalate/formate antiporter
MPIPPPRPVLAIMATVLIMLSLGSLYAWSILVPMLEAQLGLTRAQTSLVFSLATAAFALAMLAGPHLYGRTGAPALALGAMLVAAAGLGLASAALSFGTLLIGYGALFGLANGLGYGLSLQVVHASVKHRQGLATGIAVAAYASGAAIFSPVLGFAAERFGVAATLAASAAWMIAAGLAAALCLHRLGVALPKPDSSALSPPARDATFRWLWLGFLLGSAAGVMALGHAATIAAGNGASKAQAAAAVALVAVGNAAGRLGGGWLADLLAPRRGLLAAQLLLAAALLLPVVLPTTPAALAALLLAGIGYGATATLYPAAVARHYGADRVGPVYGRLFTAWGVASLAAPYLAGLLFDSAGTYRLTLILGATAALLAALTSLRLPSLR